MSCSYDDTVYRKALVRVANDFNTKIVKNEVGKASAEAQLLRNLLLIGLNLK